MFNLKGLWAEFKAFAFKGNLIDLAVAVVLGAAFGGVIKAVVDDLVMPSISYVVTGVSTAKDAAKTVANVAAEKTGIAASQPATEPTTGPTTLPAAVATPPAATQSPAPAPTPAKTKPEDAKPVQIDFNIGRFKVGHFISELLNFVIVAAAVFIVIVKLLGGMMAKVAGGTPEASEPTTKECPECLSIIPIKARRCAHCGVEVPQIDTTAPVK